MCVTIIIYMTVLSILLSALLSYIYYTVCIMHHVLCTTTVHYYPLLLLSPTTAGEVEVEPLRDLAGDQIHLKGRERERGKG